MRNIELEMVKNAVYNKNKEDVGVISPLYIVGHSDESASNVRWGHWDLNPDQRVSTTWGATPRELTGHRSS